MRKTTALIIAALLMISLLAACGARNAETQTEAPETADTAAAVAAGNEYVVNGVHIPLPDGFEVSEENGVKIAVPAEYPEVSDNITFVTSSAGKIDDYGRDFIENYYSTLFNGFGGLDYYDQIEIDGRDALLLEYSVAQDEVDAIQTQLWIFLDASTECVTYTQVQGVYCDDFVDSIEGIYID